MPRKKFEDILQFSFCVGEKRVIFYGFLAFYAGLFLLFLVWIPWVCGSPYFSITKSRGGEYVGI